MNEITVSVCCQTYNQVDYIEEAIEGFLMQKTDFRFEILIRDDASTDGTMEIVQNYALKFPELIKLLIYEENQFKKGLRPFPDNVKRARGKYIAICEGDDYWTDPLKLQKQVDILEKNNTIGLVYTQVRYFYQTNKKFSKKKWGGNATTFDELLFSNQIPTHTCVFRKDLLDLYLIKIKPEEHNWLMGDYPLWLFFALESKIFFLEDETAVYRVLEESVSHSQSLPKREKFIKSYFSVKEFFLEYSGRTWVKQQLNDPLFSTLATNALLMDNRKLAISYFKKVVNLSRKNKVKYLISKNRVLSKFYSLKK